MRQTQSGKLQTSKGLKTGDKLGISVLGRHENRNRRGEDAQKSGKSDPTSEARTSGLVASLMLNMAKLLSDVPRGCAL